MSELEPFLEVIVYVSFYTPNCCILFLFMCCTVTGGTTEDHCKAQDRRVAAVNDVNGVSSAAIINVIKKCRHYMEL
jgi:hypothetical protein